MKKYSITSLAFNGEIIYSFDEKDCFVGMEVKASLSEAQLRHFFAYMPYTSTELKATIGASQKVTVTDVIEHITFDMFWSRYNDKERSSKKRSMEKWNKLNAGNQAKAYNHILKYFRTKGNAEKKYCETYLAAELWNN
jgi:hypothetical protein